MTHLRQSWGEVVTVLVHEVVGIAFVLLPHLFHDPLHILLCEVCTAQDYGFSTQTGGNEGGHTLLLTLFYQQNKPKMAS